MARSSQAYVSERQNLLERLLDSVKQCQVRFGGKSEIAPDSDARVVCLCQQFEAVLQYGMKKSRRIAASAILTKVTSNQKQDSQPVFWSYVKEYLSKSELERFNTLEHITTDAGRGRAWLRASLNEHTLERYLQDLLADTSMLNYHYQPHAFLLDIERSSMLPQMAAGLSSILFATTVDNPDLNGLAKVSSNSSFSTSLTVSNKSQQGVPEAVVAPEAKEMMTVKKRKKKRKSKHSEFGDSEPGTAENATIYGETSSIPILPGSQSVSPLTTPSMSMQNTPSGDENAENLMKSKLGNHNDGQDIESTTVEIVSGFQMTEPRDDSPSLYSTTELGEIQIDPHASLDSWKPSSQNDVSRTRGMIIQTFGMPSETKAAVQALQAAHRAQQSLERSKYSSLSQAQSSPSTDRTENELATQSSQLPSPVVNQHSLSPDSMTNAELKQAIISAIQRKDEVEAKNSVLARECEDLTVKVESLEKDLLAFREEAALASEESQAKVQALSRENELLKHQLKRYVGVVQTMRRERSSSLTKETADALSVVPSIQPATEPLRFRAESINEADHYEKKLVQVTEMHGELMEFNESLHIQLLRKELEIRRLRSQLPQYRGVPVQDEMPKTNTQQRGNDLCPTNPGLVNVWIPTAFLNGRGADSHHVYQVFIRIRDDEWNVYRRYTQFRELYKQACLYLQSVKKFDFPPKKTLGSRDGNFVEMRRQQLQAFLRFLFEIILKGGEGIDGTSLDIKARPSKKGLMKAIPFFAENSTQRPTGPPVGGHQYSGL
ncbi:sorting nexin-29-like isoform X2 [Corticium candelabrum]|uniref:sorting nexin-29-like isoform X2 n=1 Tax=Corticium candelabrum TaxID=121492 RepID=UPI002E3400F9|nr:sorting nexin-29-like isoform X2 [Corticium candelabrum]